MFQVAMRSVEGMGGRIARLGLALPSSLGGAGALRRSRRAWFIVVYCVWVDGDAMENGIFMDKKGVVAPLGVWGDEVSPQKRAASERA